MTELNSKIRCSHCHAVLPNEHTGACPHCGKTGRTVEIGLAVAIETASRISWEKRRVYYQKRPGVLAIVIGITVLSPFLGLVLVGWVGVVVGLVIGGVAYWIGPWATTKIIEIHHG